MRKRQFRVLYREFLFRMVDLEALSAQFETKNRFEACTIHPAG